MLKKTMTYVNFDGIEITEDFYFNLTKAEVVFYETKVDGGLSSHFEKIVKSKNNPEIIQLFQEFVDMTYGEKSPDGKKFLKSKDILANFKATEAYSDLIMEMFTNPTFASEFVEKVLPKAE